MDSKWKVRIVAGALGLSLLAPTTAFAAGNTKGSYPDNSASAKLALEQWLKEHPGQSAANDQTQQTAPGNKSTRQPAQDNQSTNHPAQGNKPVQQSGQNHNPAQQQGQNHKPTQQTTQNNQQNNQPAQHPAPNNKPMQHPDQDQKPAQQPVQHNEPSQVQNTAVQNNQAVDYPKAKPVPKLPPNFDLKQRLREERNAQTQNDTLWFREQQLNEQQLNEAQLANQQTADQQTIDQLNAVMQSIGLGNWGGYLSTDANNAGVYITDLSAAEKQELLAIRAQLYNGDITTDEAIADIQSLDLSSQTVQASQDGVDTLLQLYQAIDASDTTTTHNLLVQLLDQIIQANYQGQFTDQIDAIMKTIGLGNWSGYVSTDATNNTGVYIADLSAAEKQDLLDIRTQLYDGDITADEAIANIQSLDLSGQTVLTSRNDADVILQLSYALDAGDTTATHDLLIQLLDQIIQAN